MEYAHPEALVSTEWLAENIDAPDIAIVDASFHLPAAKRNAIAEYQSGHLPGAVFFDIDDIADSDNDLPHMLPDAAQFSAQMGKLGISNDHHVICYDTNGGPGAAMRAWWMFRTFGHDNVSVLTGGLPKWQDEGRAMQSTAPEIIQKEFNATFRAELVKNVDEVWQNIESKSFQFVDARAAGRYHGTDPEPRAGMRSGHVPGALSLPFQQLFDREDHLAMKSADELQAVIDAAGIDPSLPVASSCGSGVTAAPLVMALYLLGHPNAALYDGSWTEWGGRPDTPIDV